MDFASTCDTLKGTRAQKKLVEVLLNIFTSRDNASESLFFNCFYLFLRHTERERERGRERENEWGRGREGDTESEAGSRLRAVSTEPDEGLKLRSHEIMT